MKLAFSLSYSRILGIFILCLGSSFQVMGNSDTEDEQEFFECESFDEKEQPQFFDCQEEQSSVLSLMLNSCQKIGHWVAKNPKTCVAFVSLCAAPITAGLYFIDPSFDPTSLPCPGIVNNNFFMEDACTLCTRYIHAPWVKSCLVPFNEMPENIVRILQNLGPNTQHTYLKLVQQIGDICVYNVMSGHQIWHTLIFEKSASVSDNLLELSKQFMAIRNLP